MACRRSGVRVPVAPPFPPVREPPLLLLEHLDHHAARRGGRVEGLGRRAEGDPGRLQLLDEHTELAEVAAQAIDAVHEEEIEGPRRRSCASSRQPRSLQAVARGPIDVAGDDAPVGLARHVRFETVALRAQRVGLVRLVGRDAGVATRIGVPAFMPAPRQASGAARRSPQGGAPRSRRCRWRSGRSGAGEADRRPGRRLRRKRALQGPVDGEEHEQQHEQEIAQR